jgi:NAD(P)-dependent dehydrogenase (short-subunit alcohol dehydrogenase family)
MRNIFISGVSSGIGYELAKKCLRENDRVYGVSRSTPDLLGEEHFHFARIDLSMHESAAVQLRAFLFTMHNLHSIDMVFLNAGQFGSRIAPIRDLTLRDLKCQMDINLWAHKLVLDVLLDGGVTVPKFIFSASIAGVRARAGNGGYAISKAALNMLAKLYALEHPESFFAVLGLCAVDTNLSQQIVTLPLEGDFAEQRKLRARVQLDGYVVSAQTRAAQLYALMNGRLQDHVSSGDFIEIRDLLAQAAAVSNQPEEFVA